MTPSPRAKDATTDGAPRAFPGALLIALAVTFALIAAATLLPGARDWRLWGLNHLAYYGAPVRLAAMILMALAFVPSVAGLVYDRLQRVPAALATGDSRSTLIMVLRAAGSVFLFYQLRAATTLLGDGQLLLKSFEVGHAGTSKTVVMRSAEAILRTEFIAPGQTLLYYGLVQVVTGTFKKTVADALVILPCLLGGLYAFFLLRFVRDVPASPAVKVWLLVLGLFTAGLQLFFGYIENYSAIFLLLMLYVAACFGVLHDRVRLWVPLVLFIVAVYTHIQSLVFAPSLAYLIAWRITRRNERLGGRIVVPVLIALTVAGALVGRANDIPGKFYLPFTANEDTYGIVSPWHIADMVNEIFMLLPILPVVLVLWYLGRRAAARVGEKSGWFSTPREWQFVAAVLVPCATYLVFFNPEIGMARDWDLFTMSSTALVPLVLLALNRFIKNLKPDPAVIARLTVPALVMTGVMATAWIGVNASADRTTDRYESILAYDDTHVGYAYENLATFYHSRNNLPKAIKAMERGALLSGNPRIYARLALYYEENGDIPTGIAVLQQTMERHPGHDKARQKLMDLLEKARQWDDLETVARDGMSYHPRQPIYCFALGISLVRQAKDDDAAEVFRTCLELDAPPAMRGFMENFFEIYNRKQSDAGQ